MTSLGPVRLCRDRPTDRAWHLAHGQECDQCWPDTNGIPERDFKYFQETARGWRKKLLAEEFGDDIPDYLAA